MLLGGHVGYFYKSLVHSILLKGKETWVISEANWIFLQSDCPINPSLRYWNLGFFLTKWYIKPNESGTWVYPSSASVLEEAGLYEINHYIQKRRETVLEFVKEREIYQECKDLEVDSVHTNHYWWNQSFNVQN